MDTAGDSKLSRMLECPICLEKLTNARMLKCFHFFCDECLARTKQGPPETSSVTSEQDFELSYYICSVCRQTTSSSEVGKVPIVNDILESLDIASNRCDCTMCSTAAAVYRCVDCKATYCATCKVNHDAIPTCKQHKTVKIEEDRKSVV